MIGSKPNLPVAATEPGYSLPFSTEDEPSQGGFTLPQVLQILRAHLKLSLLLFVGLVCVTALAIKKMPKSYVATAALIVNSEDKDPLAGRDSLAGTATGTFFPTQVELIENSVVLLPVVDKLQLRKDKRFTEGFVGAPNALDEIVLKNLRLALQVNRGAGSQLLYISATAREPVLAANIANTVADEYLAHSRERTNAPAAERAKRYAEQLADLREKVTAAQDKVAEFRQKYDMADLRGGAGNSDLEGAAMSDLESKLLAARNARRELEAKQVSASADSSAVIDSPEVISLRSKLNSLQGDMGQLRATLGPKHPRVVQLQSEIDATRDALQAAVRAISDNSAMQLTRARELEGKYQAAVDEERQKLLNRRDLQDQAAKLLLEQTSAQETYAKALNGMDEVQFASEGDYKDVAMVSRAEPPAKSAKPNKMKLLLMAMVLSLGLAVAGPFVYELLFDRRIRCRDDLEKHFGIVMLARFGPVPAISSG